MRKVLLVLFITAAVVFPPVTLGFGLPALRPELFVLVVAALFGTMRLRNDDVISKALLLFIPVALMSIMASYSAFSVPPNFKDFMVVPMILQYWLTYCFGKSLRNSAERELLVKWFILMVGIAALIGIFQKINFAGVNSWLTPYYTLRESAINSLQQSKDYGRSIGTVGDPRHYSYLLAVGIGACVAYLLNKVPSWFSLVSVMVMAGCFVASIATASRTVFVAIFGIVIIGSILYYKKSRNVLVLVIVFGVMFTSLILTWSQFASESVEDRLLMTGDELMSSSGNARKRDLIEPFQRALKNPLIMVTGMGPSKAVLPGSEHGDIGWTLTRFGPLGFAIYFVILYRGTKRSALIYRTTRRSVDSTWAMYCGFTIIVWLVFLLAESIFKLHQLMSINMLVLGSLFSERLQINPRKRKRFGMHKKYHLPVERRREERVRNQPIKRHGQS